ncbi:DNA internalization-related competence protein ComEC/Rec2 [Vibrio penaeicida]|uniref:DNA internalization-related competence protein ComEC/Rec2 n=1 Tax=Vibrio penaeicida TaxID=104609 RepID=UPI0027374A4F|nr:DNA internalization-related competence protein ComEC/Rec2 [Vibrio penaeicida]MDP2571268.1 DNA internalization-related competence protein ComEC/Rec2 [Vibrio penaeicida]
MKTHLSNWTLTSFTTLIASSALWTTMPSVFWVFPAIILCLLVWNRPYTDCLKGMLLGLIVVVVHSSLFQHQQRLLFSEGQNSTITGQIDSFFKQISHGYEASFVVHQLNGRKIPYLLRPTVRVIWSMDGEPPLLGQFLTLDSALKPVYGRLNEAGRDQEKHYVANRWHGKAVVKQATLLYNTTDYRQSLHSRVFNLVYDFKSAPYLLALSFGDRRGLTDSDWRHLQSSGLLHLMAISGLHIGLIFGLGWFFGRVIALVLPLPSVRVWLPIITGLIAASIYASLAGFSIPTQRALVACIILTTVKLAGVHFSNWRLLLIVCSILLLLDPFAVLSASFWLSFSAVSVIFIFIGLRRLEQSNKWQKARFLCEMQFWLLIALAPVSIFVFSGFSVLSPIYNFIFLPLVSLVTLPFVSLALLFTTVSPNLAYAFWQVADWSLNPIIWSLEWGEYGWLSLSSRYAFLAFAFVTLLVLSFQFRSVIPVMFLAVMMLWRFPHEPKPIWRVDMLDVGHGLAVLIEKNGKAILYDTGMGWEGGSYAKSVIHPVLRNQGIKYLDGFILSHLDADHAGGKGYVESVLQPNWRRASQSLEGYQPCIRGEQWYWQGLRFEAMWPPRLTRRAYNPHSCVIRISDDKTSILLTGDIDAISEFILSQQGEHLASDILVVPHHGSSTSSKSLFVDRVVPDIAIASLAKGNRWNLPSVQVREVYKSKDIKWMDTGEEGQISILIYKDKWDIKTARAEHSPRWYRQIVRKGVE